MRKCKKIILLVVLVNIGLLITFVIGVGEKPPLAIWTTNEGVEYKIMAIGQLYFSTESEHMLTLSYISKDPTDPHVRQVEFHDLYTMVAQKLKLDNFGSVGLEAVDKAQKAFGISRSSGYRDRKSVDEVRQLLIQETPNNDIQSAPSAADADPRIEFHFIEVEAKTLSDMKLEEKPFLTDTDILTYTWTNHTMSLKPKAVARLPGMKKVGTGGKAFVVIVDGERRYRGAFWCLYSSIGHFHPVILASDHYDPARITIYRMYPTLNLKGEVEMNFDGQKIPVKDPRDDDALKRVLKKLGKLKEVKATNKAIDARNKTHNNYVQTVDPEGEKVRFVCYFP